MSHKLEKQILNYLGYEHLPPKPSLTRKLETKKRDPEPRKEAKIKPDCQNCGSKKYAIDKIPKELRSLVFIEERSNSESESAGLFSGEKSKELLYKMIGAMGLDPYKTIIIDSAKCTDKIDFSKNEKVCDKLLKEQVAEIKPKLVILLGSAAYTSFTGEKKPELSKTRGRIEKLKGQDLLLTYNPSYLLRAPENKRRAWNDLKLAMEFLGLKKGS